MLLNMSKKRIPFSQQLRQAVARCGLSQYAIGKATGINKATLSRFVSGERGLPMKTLDCLTDFLDLNVIAGPCGPRGKDRVTHG